MVSDRLWRTQRAADSKRKKTDGEKAAGSRKKERQPVCQTVKEQRAAGKKKGSRYARRLKEQRTAREKHARQLKMRKSECMEV